MIGNHAVVVGGSIGGLTAARALTSRFDRVTVLDRDELPAEPHDRRAVPQARHGHALLISGRVALEKLFPGLTGELIADGAIPWDPGHDLLFHQLGAFRIRYSTGMLGVSLTRAFLEFALRRRVRALPNAEVRDRSHVIALTGAPGRVTGVELENGEQLTADLVVDATGRGGGRSERWLEQLGCPPVEVDTVKIDVGYTSRLLRRQPGEGVTDTGGLIYLMASISPDDKRAAAAFAVEGDRWLVTLGGWHRAYAPVDPDGFIQFAAGLPAPHMADLLSRAEPLDDRASRYTYPASRRRYFERLRQPPAGYVALGDAICSFNPLYGQGMTVAILEAIELGRCLDRFAAVSTEMTGDYFHKVGKLIDMPWQIATAGDFIFPETIGPRAPGTGVMNWYLRQVTLASHTSVKVHRAMLEVQHMLAAPSAVMHPAVMARSLLAAWRSPGG